MKRSVPQTHWGTRLAVLALAVLAGIFVASCKSGGKSATVTISGAGATFPYPLYSKWFDAYGMLHRNVRINYQSIGSGGGIRQLKEGTVDFGASDAPLSDAEMKEMPAPVVHLPMAAGAVVLAYNLPGVTALRLDGPAIAGIFLGDITDWSDARLARLNPGVALPRLPVVVARRADGSGTSYIFTNYLSAVSAAWKSRVGAGKSVNWPVGVGGKGNEGVTGVLKQTAGSIGYVELAYAHQNDLAYATVKNAAGTFVEPTIASTTAAAAGAVAKMKGDVRVSIVNAAGPDAYPISGFTYILLYQDQKDDAKGKALVDFLQWAIHEGQGDAEGLMYAPLPEAVVALNEATLRRITSGGKPLLSTAE